MRSTQFPAPTLTISGTRRRRLRGFDAVVLPGGFSYGDYLRCGAIARFSPIMRAVKSFAADGGMVIGICNGFQILCESGLLPGALVRNRGLHFICEHIHVRVERHNSPFTNATWNGAVLRLPIAHGEGCYFAEDAVLHHLEREGRVLFRYCDARGRTTEAANPNGSKDNIAGILQRGAQRLRPHASSGASLRPALRQHRWPPHLSKHARVAGLALCAKSPNNANHREHRGHRGS